MEARRLYALRATSDLRRESVDATSLDNDQYGLLNFSDELGRSSCSQSKYFSINE